MFSLEKFLRKNRKILPTEIIAALTTFFTMAYILVVNPRILSDAGMPFQAVFTATALAAGIGCMIMGLRSDKPLAVATGMGLNAYFAYTVVIGMGMPWQAALAAVFAAAALMFLLAFSRIKISEAIPQSFKHALIAGLGFFLVFIGMQNAHFVVTNPATVVALGDLGKPAALIGVFGFLITALSVARGVKGALFIGVVVTTLLAMVSGLAPLPQGIFGLPPSPAPLLFKLDFTALAKVSLLPVVWTIFIISFFDTVGTNIALLTKAGYAEMGGNVKGFRKALEADGLAGMVGAVLGVPSLVTYLESATGVDSGGKTGLVAIGVGALFFVSLFFFPLISAIPIEAAAPAMIIVGLFMLSSVGKIEFNDTTEALPALLTLGAIPLTFSISNGIAAGSISYVFLKLVTGRHKEIHPAMYLIALLSVLQFAHVF
jgi:AGZA family xanthine/uracil permease-like MFS transporter